MGLGIRVMSCEAKVYTCDREHSCSFSNCRQPIIEYVNRLYISSKTLIKSDILIKRRFLEVRVCLCKVWDD